MAVELVRKQVTDGRAVLNPTLTDGIEMVGSRLGRAAHYLERQGVYDCKICDFPHVDHECWCVLPDASVFSVRPVSRWWPVT